MPICEGCGGSYEVSHKFCPNCGRAAPQARTQDRAYMGHQSLLTCPKCQRDDRVEKVTSILKGGTNKFQYKLPVTTVRTDEYGRTSSDTSWEKVSATQMTDRARELVPPPPPAKIGVVLEIIRLIMLILFSFCGISYVVSTLLAQGTNIVTMIKEGSLPFTTNEILLYTLLFVGVWVWVLSSLITHINYRKNYPSYKKLWEEAMQRYNNLYYCFRDESIFVPGENTYTPASNLMAYIKWHPYTKKPIRSWF